MNVGPSSNLLVLIQRSNLLECEQMPKLQCDDRIRSKLKLNLQKPPVDDLLDPCKETAPEVTLH